MISRCGNGVTASGAGVIWFAKLPVGTMLPSAGLTLPATRLIAAPALDACSCSAPIRSCTCDAALVACPYIAATCPTFVCATLMPRIVRCSFSPMAGPMNGMFSSSEAAPVISPTAPVKGPSMSSRLRRPTSPAAIRYFNDDCSCSA